MTPEEVALERALQAVQDLEPMRVLVHRVLVHRIQMARRVLEHLERPGPYCSVEIDPGNGLCRTRLDLHLPVDAVLQVALENWLRATILNALGGKAP